MPDVPYTTVPGKVKGLLSKLREVGIPSKATVQWLRSVGFKSSNDVTLIGVLKAVGFVDGSGVPTSVWTKYRGADHRRVLGDAIRQGYAELFAVYPDAPTRSQTDIEHVFSTSTSAGKQVISKAVSTFKALCESAEFPTGADAPDLQFQAGPLHRPIANTGPEVAPSRPTHAAPTVHIDIQVHISAEAGADQIENIFKSMAKHLYGPKSTE